MKKLLNRLLSLFKNNRPILITGSHRSGTTWAGKMLCLSGNLHSVFEPFNIAGGAFSKDKRFKHWFEYINSNNETSDLVEAFKNVINNKNDRVVFKDPIAILSSEWMSKRFNSQVVMLIRHPAAVVSSLVRLDWRFDFTTHFLSQEQLMDDYLNIYADEIKSCIEKNDKIIEASILWKCLYFIASEYIKRNKNFIVMRHEDLSSEPLKNFKYLYKKLGLKWTQQIENEISQFCSSQNPTEAPDNVPHHLHRHSKSVIKIWKGRLSADDIKKIKDITYPVSSLYYSDEDW